MLSHDDSAVINKGKEPLVNSENFNPPAESPEVQAAEETGAFGSAEGSGSDATVPNINGTSEAFPPPSNSSKKRGRGRPKGSGKWQAFASFGEFADTAGGSVTPHVLPVYKGEDIVGKIRSFHGRTSRAFFVLTATGPVSRVTLRMPGSDIGTLTYEGWFEILGLSGSCVQSDDLGTHGDGVEFNVTVADSHGRVFGGIVAGPLIAAGPGPIQLIIGSFKQNVGRKMRKKYADESASKSANMLVDVPIQVDGNMVDGNENCTLPPAPVTMKAENHNFNSIISPENVGPNNWQKADHVKAGNNLIAENQVFNPTWPQSVGPNNNLETLPASHLTSDEMMIPVNIINKNVPQM